MKFPSAVVAVASACALTISACTSPSPEPSAVPPLSIDVSILLDEATEGDASDEQLVLLERALAEQTLSYDDLNVQFLASAQCLEDAGFTVIVDQPEELYPGVPHPTMRYQDPPGLSQDDASKISAKCDRTHFVYVDSFYVSQPVAIDAYLATFDAQRASIVECLAERGYTVDPDASPTELLYVVTEEQLADPSSPLAPCYQGAVFNGFARP